MIGLLAGLVLWFAAHGLGRLLPDLRRDMEMALGRRVSKALVAIALLAALFLIFTGYRNAAFISIYDPIAGSGHINNLLMLVAVFVFGIGFAGGRLFARLRHPMLWGAIIWSVAHLFVNGDLASIFLFGGLGMWAIFQMAQINRHEGPWERPMPGNAVQDVKLGLVTLFAYLVIAGIHWLSGHNPFLGNY